MRKEQEIRNRMYLDYCRELDRYSRCEHATSAADAAAVAGSYAETPGFEWIDIHAEDTREICGFLIVGRDLSVHGKGLYICEAYVSPEMRRNGLMAKAAGWVLREHDAPVYLEIYDRNEGAKMFWRKFFRNVGYIQSGLRMSGAGVPGLVEHTYERG